MNAFLKILAASVGGAALNGAAQAAGGQGVDLTTVHGWGHVGAGAAVAALTTTLALLLQSPLAKQSTSLLQPSELQKAEKDKQ